MAEKKSGQQGKGSRGQSSSRGGSKGGTQKQGVGSSRKSTTKGGEGEE